MSTLIAADPEFTAESSLTAEELAARIGAVPLWRVRTDPSPGSATEADVERIRRDEDRICELIDGVLVEKAVSDKSAFVAAELIFFLNSFVRPRRIGWVLAPDGYVWLFGRHLRAPDVSFVRRNQRPGGKVLSTGYADVAPVLAVEVFSPGNTTAELERKRTEFFAAGTELFWIVYPERQEIVVSTGPDEHRTLGPDDLLDGGTVLPGFTLKVADLFERVNLGDA
jgi:Uma2 family endonuclease